MITIPLTLRQHWFPLRGKKKKPLLINYDMSYSTNAVIMLKKKCISESLACSNSNDNMNDQHLLRSHEVSGIVDFPWRELSLSLFLSHNGAMDAGGAVKPSSLPPQLLITSCWDTFCICQTRVDLLCIQPLSDQHWWSPVGAGGRVGGELPSRTFPSWGRGKGYSKTGKWDVERDLHGQPPSGSYCPFPGSCSSRCYCVWDCSPSSPWSTGNKDPPLSRCLRPDLTEGHWWLRLAMPWAYQTTDIPSSLLI